MSSHVKLTGLNVIFVKESDQRQLRFCKGQLITVLFLGRYNLVTTLCKVAPTMPIMMMFHITKNSTKTKIAFSGLEQESQKLLLLSLNRWVLLTLKCVGGGGGSCIYSPK